MTMRLGYCNFIIAVVARLRLHQIQSVFNFAAQVIANKRRPYNGIYAKTAALASCCEAYYFRDHHSDTCHNCRRSSINSGAMCSTLEAIGSANVALCGLWRQGKNCPGVWGFNPL